jgi:hypothetical protein
VIAAPNALIDEHHENLVLVAKENRAAAAHRGYGADLHFDNGFTHITNLVIRLPPRSGDGQTPQKYEKRHRTYATTRSLDSFSPFYLNQPSVY